MSETEEDATFEYFTNVRCTDPECIWMFPHTRNESCRPDPFIGLNVDDDPALL